MEKKEFYTSPETHIIPVRIRGIFCGSPNLRGSSNEFTLTRWEKLEAAGCVFLLLTNYRTKDKAAYPGDGVYWCGGNAGSTTNARYFGFNDTAVGTSNTNNFGSSGNEIRNNKTILRYNGCAVRLVRVVN